MGYLEKVFLGSLILFALLIVFMFGLYFDIGSMLQGTVQRTSDLGGPGGSGRATAQIERAAVKPEITVKDIHARPLPTGAPSSSSRYDTSAAAANFESIYARVSHVKPPPTMEEKMDLRRKQLAAKGFGQDFIEMDARSMDERAVIEASSKADELIAKGNFDEAEKLILEQIEACDPRDHINLQRLRMKLQQVYFDGGKLDRYKETMKQLFDTEDKVLAIQAASKLMEDTREAETIKLKQADLARKRGEFDQYFEQIQQQVRDNGSVGKLSDRQMGEIKAGLLREQEAGRISPQALQDALAQLDTMGQKGGVR